MNPLSAAAMPYMPMTELRPICTTSYQTVSMNSIDGLKANTYGMINAAMASLVAITPVFMGLPLDIAEPA